jgi:NRE family putative nickel resistance protein-like MFS transporter
VTEESEAPGSPAAAGLFRNRNFARLFAAQLASLLGSGVTSIALAAFAYDLARGNATVVVGTALTLRILAFVTLSPLAGVLADRVDRKRMLVAADLLRVGLLGLFPFVTTVWHVYLLIFAINAVTAFFTPTFEAAIPDVVGPRLYTRAVSLSRVAVDLESAGGPLVAAVLIAIVGVRWTFWFDAGTYLVSALLVLASHVPSAPKPKERFPWRDFVPQVTHGTRLLLREPALRQALVLHFAEAVAGAVAIVTTVVYVRDELRLGDSAFAWAMAALGAGSTLASIALARRADRVRRAGGGPEDEHLRYHRWARRTLLVGGMMLGVALLPGFIVPGLGVLLLLWALTGAGEYPVARSAGRPHPARGARPRVRRALRADAPVLAVHLSGRGVPCARDGHAGYVHGRRRVLPAARARRGAHPGSAPWPPADFRGPRGPVAYRRR